MIYKTGDDRKKVRLDVFLKENIESVSREKIKKSILAGHVKVDGQECLEPSFKLKPGQEVEADVQVEPEDLVGEQMALEKVYESDDFLVINKPPGLVVHPGAGIKTGTLVHGLLWHYPEIANIGHPIRPAIVHRLDKDTSGLMLVAKNERSFEYAKALFKERNISKEYVALLEGRLEPERGIIEKPLLLDPARRKVKVSEGGKYAKTEYKVLGYYRPKAPRAEQKENGSSAVDIYTLVSVILHTGRTHQIRVHFSSLGYPLAGDTTYGAKTSLQGLERQFLHAAKLAFRLPDETSIELGSELPGDLQSVLNNLEPIS